MPKDYTGNSGTIYLRGYSIDGLGQLWYQSFNLNSKDWVKFTYTFKTDSFYTDKTASFAFGVANKVDADFASPSLIQLDDITLGGGINSLVLYCLFMLSFLYNNVRR